MRLALETLQETRLPGVSKSADNIIQDPLGYTMFGDKESPITTDEGRIQEKITVLNPNFSAIVVDMLNQLNLKPGDNVGVTLTGSLPGANLAVFSAIKALKLNPVIITSAGSSWWGANNPDFTWLDMETALVQKGVFNFKSKAASIGGSDDEGGLRLSRLGKQLLIDAINRNQVTLINEGGLSANIEKRMQVFSQFNSLDNYSALINVGGGIAAIGHSANSNLLPRGVVRKVPMKNYPGKGILHQFSDVNVPLIMIDDVESLAGDYNLPLGIWPLPLDSDKRLKIGYGKVFEEEKYNLLIASISLFLMMTILISVKIIDYRRLKWSEEQVDPDTII